MGDGCRDMAKEASDFDPIRDELAFDGLIGAPMHAIRRQRLKDGKGRIHAELQPR